MFFSRSATPLGIGIPVGYLRNIHYPCFPGDGYRSGVEVEVMKITSSR